MKFLSKLKQNAISNLETIEKLFEMVEHFMQEKIGLQKNRKVTIGLFTAVVVLFGSIDINMEALIAGLVVLGVMVAREPILKHLKKEEISEEKSEKKDDKSSEEDKKGETEQ